MTKKTYCNFIIYSKNYSRKAEYFSETMPQSLFKIIVIGFQGKIIIEPLESRRKKINFRT